MIKSLHMRASALSIDIQAVVAYLIAIVLSTGLLIWIMDLRSADLRIPFSYGGDALLCESMIKGLIDNGWYLHNSYIGIPEGQYLYDYPVNSNLDVIIMKIISLFGANYAMTMNIYFLLTFILTTITTMLVLRHFKVSYLLSILGSLLFSFVPYHFLRGEPHLFLAAYYMIPPIVMVILWVSTSTSFLFISFPDNMACMKLLTSKSLMCIVICVLISSAFIYYPFFSCFFLFIAGITGYISQHSKYPLLNSIILISIIILGVLVNVSPSLIYQHENGKNTEVAIRYPMESEIYGLKIAQLLMPISGHRIPLLAKFSGYYSGTAPLVNEDAFASLGIIGSVGFLLLIAWEFYRASSGLKLKANDILSHINELSILNFSAVLLATLGSFGSLFAYLIFPEIRGYNRISIFIAFFSLFAVVLFLEMFSRKYIKSKTSRLLFNLIIGLVLVSGVLDQTSKSFVPSYASTKTEYLNDENFINNIEAIMPENAMIFQLPYMPFPENKPIYQMADYTHFKAYLHSKELRWSYGAMKGRSGNDWQRAVASMPIGDMIKTLSLTGFEGIYIDCYGFKDGGVELLSNISQILKIKPLVNSNKRLYFFDMIEYNRRNSLDNNTRGNQSNFDFPFSEGSVLHCRYDNNTFSYISRDGRVLSLPGEKVLDPISLNGSFSIDILVQPHKKQVVYAAILGNHPGKGYEGFVIQQNSVNENEYTFSFGNGKKWLPNIKFNLTENQLNHLLIDVRKNQTNIYVDGKFVGSVNTIESIKNSDLPLYIGNWIGGDRPFNGVVNEIKIVNGDQND